jgi:regulator of chromosome condensation
MGPDVLGEIPKPKRNLWVEEKMENDTFGEDNAGMEFVVSGGLHTIFIDERGTV